MRRGLVLLLAALAFTAPLPSKSPKKNVLGTCIITAIDAGAQPMEMICRFKNGTEHGFVRVFKAAPSAGDPCPGCVLKETSNVPSNVPTEETR